jgi:hypothetical protein
MRLTLGACHRALVSWLNLLEVSTDFHLNFPPPVAPPPPEFSDIVSSHRSLHIPTQPSHQHQVLRQHPPSHYMMQQQQYHMMHQQNQQRVRIVGALPKQSVQQQPGKTGHHHIHHFHSHQHHQHH